MRNKSLCAILTVSIALGCFSGCGKKSANNDAAETSASKEVSLTLWGAANDQKMLGEMVDSFKKENADKNYTITLKVMGEDEAKTEVQKDPSAAGDVYAIAHDQLGALVNSDAVYENTIYADDVKKNSIDAAISASTYNGKLYGYPASQKTYFLYYDKRIFSDEDVKSLDKMLEKEVPSGVSKLGLDIKNAYYSAAFFFTNGCELFGKDGTDENTVTFNNEHGLEAATYLTTLKSKGVVSVDDASSDPQFAAGKLGAYISGDWKAESIKEKLGENYGVAELPSVDMGSGEKHMKSFSGFNIYCVKAKTKFPEEAMALANFITNKNNQKKRFEMRNLLPVNKELVSDNSLKSDPTVSAIFKQLNHCVLAPAIPRVDKFWAPMGAFTKDAFDGNIPVSNLQTKLDSLVSDIKS